MYTYKNLLKYQCKSDKHLYIYNKVAFDETSIITSKILICLRCQKYMQIYILGP